MWEKNAQIVNTVIIVGTIIVHLLAHVSFIKNALKMSVVFSGNPIAVQSFGSYSLTKYKESVSF